MRTAIPVWLLTSVLAARAVEAPPKGGESGKTTPISAVASPTPAPTNSAAKSVKESLTTTVVDPESRELKPRDGFRFSIDEDPPVFGANGSLDMGVSISDAGEVMFPVSRSSSIYIKLNVAGKKLAEVRKEVKERLDAEYYKNCTIHLDLVQVNRGGNSVDQAARVTFYGEMAGVVTIAEGESLTISEAVLRVGRSEYADLKKVKIHRLDKATGKDVIFDVNVDKILKSGDRREDKVLQAGDRVEVKEKGLF